MPKWKTKHPIPHDMKLYPLSDWYAVSKDGRVFSRRVNREMRQIRHASGRLWVSVKEGERYASRFVAPMVLKTFVGPRPQGFHAAHLDGDLNNNTIENLRWVPQSTNEEHKALHGTLYCGSMHHSAKLTWPKVRVIRDLATIGTPSKQIAEMFEVNPGTIRKIVSGNGWRPEWEYMDIARAALAEMEGDK